MSSHLDYGSGEPAEIGSTRKSGSRSSSGHCPLRPLEWAVLAHIAILVLALTWGFGGGAEWLRPAFGGWASLSALLTLLAVRDRDVRQDGRLKTLWWLLPLAAFNALVLASGLNPSFREMAYGSEVILVPSEVSPLWPSSARPQLALYALWLFDALWLSAFNLALVIRQRRALRGLLLLLVLNTLALAIFGTAQKLSGAKGLFFDAVASPQIAFFASFVYHNHWGTFAVLSLAVCLALIGHYAGRSESRNFFHTPAFGGVIAAFFMAATVPLSTSRSCTVLVVLLLGVTLGGWFVRLIRRRHRFRESVGLPILGGIVAVTLALAGVWFIARDSITIRVAKTREQVDEIRQRGDTGARGELYRNTWQMARDKPWFGWGMASYPHVFRLYNTRQSIDKLPVFYRDAHSDWLQSLAEHGFIGSALLALTALLPLLHLRRRHFVSPVLLYPLSGCALVLLYAWVEFPFGNLAVVLVWWLCLFSAVHYARLSDRDAARSPPKTGA